MACGNEVGISSLSVNTGISWVSAFVQHPDYIPSAEVELSSYDRKHEALEAKMVCYLVF